MSVNILYQSLLEKPFVIVGPCVLENYDIAMQCAEALIVATQNTSIIPIFKASFDKANRTSLSSFRGIGLEESLTLFERIKAETGLPILTDVHEIGQAEPLARVVDIIQIPAFLCRQTSLLIDVAKTNVIVNIKKGQFLAPWDMKHSTEKIVQSKNKSILLTERGVSFGYNTLVVDFRSFYIMQEFGFPVIFDATHSVQEPSALGSSSGGKREYVPMLVRAAIVAGVKGIFMECHPSPDKALCDGPNSIALSWFKKLFFDMNTLWNLNYETKFTE
ncbi:MAG: 3-deoxy-8-phosphooctulonate synthase [Desulfovibrionaceae bacterium]